MVGVRVEGFGCIVDDIQIFREVALASGQYIGNVHDGLPILTRNKCSLRGIGKLGNVDK